MLRQIINTTIYPSSHLGAINNTWTKTPKGLSPSYARQQRMFYRCSTFKYTKIRTLLLFSLTPISFFNGQVVVNVIEIEQSKCTTNIVHITTHKRGYQSLGLTFSLIKCLINELHPAAWGLKDYRLKSMPAKNGWRTKSSAIQYSALSRLLTLVTSSINELSVWLTERPCTGIWKATFVHRHSSVICGHIVHCLWLDRMPRMCFCWLLVYKLMCSCVCVHITDLQGTLQSLTVLYAEVLTPSKLFDHHNDSTVSVYRFPFWPKSL